MEPNAIPGCPTLRTDLPFLNSSAPVASAGRFSVPAGWKRLAVLSLATSLAGVVAGVAVAPRFLGGTRPVVVEHREETHSPTVAAAHVETVPVVVPTTTHTVQAPEAPALPVLPPLIAPPSVPAPLPPAATASTLQLPPAGEPVSSFTLPASPPVPDSLTRVGYRAPYETERPPVPPRLEVPAAPPVLSAVPQAFPAPLPSPTPSASRPAFETLQVFNGHTGAVTCVAFAPGGRVLSASLDGTIRLWEGGSGQLVHTFTGHEAAVNCLAVSPDGRYLLSGSGQAGVQNKQPVEVDCTVRLWDLQTGRELHAFAGHDGRVISVAFSPDGRFALSGSLDRTARVWELKEPYQEKRRLEGHGGKVEGVAFCPDGGHVVTASDEDHAVRLWELDSGNPIATLAGHQGAVKSLALSSNGRRVVSGSGSRVVEGNQVQWIDPTIRVWDLTNGSQVGRLEGHTQAVTSLALTTDDRRLLSGSMDGTVRLWDLGTGREVQCLTGHTGWVWSVAISPDGRYALSGGNDHTVRLWRLGDGAR